MAPNNKISLISIIAIITVSFSNGKVIEPFKGSDVLKNVPLIDGHNDLPYNIRNKLKNNLELIDFTKDLRNDPLWGVNACKSCHTDIPRLREGKVGGQFWVAYVPCGSQFKDAAEQTFEQIDLIKRLIQKYSKDLRYVDSSHGIKEAFKDGKIASMIVVEGGHSMDSRLGLLRQYYEMGVRYMTLTHSCNTPWGDASPVDDPKINLTSLNNGLSDWGKKVVLEMNRIGMMVDISHVSHKVQLDAINVSKAPIIFSHSSSFSVYNHHRNVHDDVLKLVPKNGGIVMVNFYSDFVHDPTKGPANISHVVDHINHIFDIAGPDHVGIGADYDGVSSTPIGLEDVSKYPQLFDLLAEKYPEKWTRENLEKLAGNNLLRVFTQVEEVKAKLQNELPEQEWIPEKDLWKFPDQNLEQCRTELSKPNNFIQL